jgi:hypothetical protein
MFMRKGILTGFTLLLVIMHANAQIGVMKLVGPGTKDYSFGFGAFVKTGIPVSDGADATIEIGADFFPDKDYPGDYGTAMCPLKLGYRYTLNGTGQGLYVEPQAGFNLYGVTSMQDDYGHDVDLKYHGVVLAAGAGYLFSLGRTPFDLNLRYETIIAHGGSNNIISLGISRTISFGKRNSDY